MPDFDSKYAILPLVLILAGAYYIGYGPVHTSQSYDTVNAAQNSQVVGNNVYTGLKLESNQSLFIARGKEDGSGYRYNVIVNYSDSDVRSFYLEDGENGLTRKLVAEHNLKLNRTEKENLRKIISDFESGKQVVYDCSGKFCSKKFIDNWFLRKNDWYPSQDRSSLEGENRSNPENVSLRTDPGNFVQAPLKEKYRLRKRPVSLEQPWDIDRLKNGDLLVTESVGNLYRIDPETWEQEKINFPRNYTSHDTTGLLGLETVQQGNENIVYLYYTYRRGEFYREHRVSKFRLVEGELRDEKVLIDKIPGAKWHSGGRLEIGPDNRLYVTTGDANTMIASGDKNLLAGKILRINLDGTVPESNPWGDLIFAKGLRNPQGLAWDPETGKQFITEHGLVHHDAVHSGSKGEDYGWPIKRCGINYLEKYSIESDSIEKYNETYREFFNESIDMRDAPVNKSDSKSFCTGNWTIAPSGAEYVSGLNSSINGELLVAGMRGKHIHHFEIQNGKIVDNYIGGFRDRKGRSGRYRHIEQIGDRIYVLGKASGLYEIVP